MEKAYIYNIYRILGLIVFCTEMAGEGETTDLQDSQMGGQKRVIIMNH